MKVFIILAAQALRLRDDDPTALEYKKMLNLKSDPKELLKGPKEVVGGEFTQAKTKA